MPVRSVVQGARAGAGLLTDLVFPRRCGLCGAFGSFLCERCCAALPRTGGGRCPTCADLMEPIGGCRTCGAPGIERLDAVVAVFAFDGGARRLVHRLKYERLSALAAPMGGLLASGLERLPFGQTPDLIAPVPLHRRRQRDRGFNQSALLARVVARSLGIAVDERLLVRVRSTAPQVRQGGLTARAANVDGAFACRGSVEGRTVLLVDDVATTGATLRACAAPLRAAGARAVCALVFAHG
ncbi:MAG: ComF family protein [Chloroflexi bacterium]|nr:ComF family protein [Chloroflexota bacterium]